MRAAAAAFPEPCSATTSTGTSFCDSSRITASTVRMPALTLSSQTRAPPFCGAPPFARISVRSRLILFHFNLFRRPRQRGDVLDKGAHSLEHTRCQSSQNVCASLEQYMTMFQRLALETLFGSMAIRYHIADKWENYCPHLKVTSGALLPTCLGDKEM